MEYARCFRESRCMDRKKFRDTLLKRHQFPRNLWTTALAVLWSMLHTRLEGPFSAFSLIWALFGGATEYSAKLPISYSTSSTEFAHDEIQINH